MRLISVHKLPQRGPRAAVQTENATSRMDGWIVTGTADETPSRPFPVAARTNARVRRLFTGKNNRTRVVRNAAIREAFPAKCFISSPLGTAAAPFLSSSMRLRARRSSLSSLTAVGIIMERAARNCQQFIPGSLLRNGVSHQQHMLNAQ